MDLAGLDNLVRGGGRLVFDVADGFEHHEQAVAVAVQFGALIGDHREFVQPERVDDPLQLPGIGLEQPDPDEPVATAANFGDRLSVGPVAGQPLTTDVHRTVHNRRCSPGAGRRTEYRGGVVIKFPDDPQHGMTAEGGANSRLRQCPFTRSPVQ